MDARRLLGRLLALAVIVISLVPASGRSAPYRVERGDTLWELAKDRVGTHLTEIWRWIVVVCEDNEIADPRLIRTGSVLDLPEDPIPRSRDVDIPATFRPPPSPSDPVLARNSGHGLFSLYGSMETGRLRLVDEERGEYFDVTPLGKGGLQLHSPYISMTDRVIVDIPEHVQVSLVQFEQRRVSTTVIHTNQLSARVSSSVPLDVLAPVPVASPSVLSTTPSPGGATQVHAAAVAPLVAPMHSASLVRLAILRL